MSALPAQHHADLAAEALYERYAEHIRRFCANRLGSAEEAEDATQSTFLNALRALRRGTTPELEAAWLYAIARNVCRERHAHAPPPAADLDALGDVLPATQRDEQGLEAIRSALLSLPTTQRRAVLLREWRGLSYREIGHDLGLSQGAVEALLFRARRSLAEALKDAAPVTRRRRALGLPSLLGTFKSWLGGGALAVKIAAGTSAAVVAAAGAATLADAFPDRQQGRGPAYVSAGHRAATPPTDVARAARKAGATHARRVAPDARTVARRTGSPASVAPATGTAGAASSSAAGTAGAASSSALGGTPRGPGVAEAVAAAPATPAEAAATTASPTTASPQVEVAITATATTPIATVAAQVPAVVEVPSVKLPVSEPATPQLPAVPELPAVQAAPLPKTPAVSTDAALAGVPQLPAP